MMVFDGVHEMAGVAGGEGRFGTRDGSDQGIAGGRRKNLLPRARVLYVSATGASDDNNLAYATRLGLWGPTTARSAEHTSEHQTLMRISYAVFCLKTKNKATHNTYSQKTHITDHQHHIQDHMIYCITTE